MLHLQKGKTKPKRKIPEVPRLICLHSVPFETQSTEELSALFNMHSWWCVKIMMSEEGEKGAVTGAWEKVGESPFH